MRTCQVSDYNMTVSRDREIKSDLEMEHQDIEIAQN